LPAMVLFGNQAASVVDTAERLLWTPMGLRSLAPDDPAYVGTIEGDSASRARAMYQGGVWPWLLGPMLDAWVRVRASERAAGGGRVPVGVLAALRAEGRKKFLRGIARHLDTDGAGHVSECADGDDPHRPRGAPFSAWSLAEVARAMLG
jgi:glycogen debranching enzyme